jgi:hypothetical protein
MDSKERKRLYNRDRYKENKDKIDSRMKQWSATNVLNGLCTQCRQPSLPHSKNLCEKHYFTQKSAQQLKTTSHWQDLKKMLEQQEYRCPYTGNILVLGLNTAIDHKYPKKRFPELSTDISNIQWIDKRVNLVKNDLTHQEFIDLCKLVASNNS